MAGMGFSFQPGTDTIGLNRGQFGSTPEANQPEQPAKILSLRLPKNLGQSPVTARELLMAPGAGGSPAMNSVIAELMRSFGGGGSNDERPQQDRGPMRSAMVSAGLPAYIRQDQINLGQPAPIPRFILNADGRQQVDAEPGFYGTPWALGYNPVTNEQDQTPTMDRTQPVYGVPWAPGYQPTPNQLQGLFD